VLAHQPHRSAISSALSKRGFVAIDQLPRRVPRWEVQVEHDLAIAWMVAELRRPNAR